MLHACCHFTDDRVDMRWVLLQYPAVDINNAISCAKSSRCARFPASKNLPPRCQGRGVISPLMNAVTTDIRCSASLI